MYSADKSLKMIIYFKNFNQITTKMMPKNGRVSAQKAVVLGDVQSNYGLK
jgi:hypothetical protein